jgi:hypothetical protein
MIPWHRERPQPRANAHRFRGKEGFENACLQRRGNAGTRVCHGERDTRTRRITPGSQGQLPQSQRFAQRLVCIGDKARDHLLYLVGISPQEVGAPRPAPGATVILSTRSA